MRSYHFEHLPPQKFTPTSAGSGGQAVHVQEATLAKVDSRRRHAADQIWPDAPIRI